MERGKRAKKINLDGSEEGGAPSSSLSLSQSQSQDPGHAESGQGSKFKEASVNDLPPEMWMEILKRVDIRSLYNCRLVNRQWNEISSEILLQRSDAKVTFMFTERKFYEQRPKKQQEERSFNNFLMCMNESENCPFARFGFVCYEKYSRSVYSDFFSHEDFKEFLSAVDESNENQNRNPRIKIKSLEFLFRYSRESVEILIGNLKELLWNKITGLVEFGLNLPHVWFKEHAEMRLFPETDEKSVVQLPHLKTIHFNQAMTSTCPGILKDLLDAAVNLNKIYLYQSSQSFFTEIYDFLQPLGKFHLLKSFELNIDDEFLLQVKERPDFTDALFQLELEELKLDVDSNFDAAHVPHATIFLSSFFESRKHSLKKLRISPLWILPSLRFPRFKNLTELKLRDRRGHYRVFFPPGVGSLDIFPAVRELDLSECDWYAAFPHLDSTPIFPRVQTLCVGEVGFMADRVRALSLLFPNLKHFILQRHKWDLVRKRPAWNFLEVGRWIWTEMKQLESLEIVIHVDLPENNPLALDSCFTGISLENCQRLCEIREAKKTLENLGPQTKSESSESELKAEREHPSILDMKNLKWLKINAYSGGRVMKRKDFFSEKLTWISQEYAFKFLPHLKPEPEPEEETEEETKSESTDCRIY